MRARLNLSVGFMVLLSSAPVFAETASAGDLQQELQALQSRTAGRSNDLSALLRLAEVYLDLGDDGYVRRDERLTAYEAGAEAAKRALDLDEANGEAHYLYAANLGSATELKGALASAFTLAAIKHHVWRALELRPQHGPTLHMVGMLLEELPWAFGGDRTQALRYLEAAVAADPSDDHARLDLAKAHIRRHHTTAAFRELQDLVAHQGVKPGRRQEAQDLLSGLQEKRVP